ncbi:hypothetical protein ACFW81_24060 [Streptomyces angustmyceticus]|uniref:hypothetical protein n=1 Tax=Streptomyces angustmyceticus TaxID=285578 RepID=UPI00367D71EC
MPGRQPAGTTPPALTATDPGPADTRATRRGHLRAVEEAPMPGAPTPDERLAIAIQSIYLSRGMSLSDPDTAAAYETAVEAVARIIVDGTFKAGRLGEEEHRRLRAYLDAAALVPEHLTGTHGR